LEHLAPPTTQLPPAAWHALPTGDEPQAIRIVPSTSNTPSDRMKREYVPVVARATEGDGGSH
jgi:hypothetical protein